MWHLGTWSETLPCRWHSALFRVSDAPGTRLALEVESKTSLLHPSQTLYSGQHVCCSCCCCCLTPKKCGPGTWRRLGQTADTLVGRKQTAGRGRSYEVALPTASEGVILCLAAHLGLLMPFGHCQPSWQRLQLLLALVGGIFHSATQPEAVLGVVGSGRWPGGYLSGQSSPSHPFSLPTLGAGRESRQGMLMGLRRGHLAIQLWPAQTTLCPPKLELKLPTGPLGLPSSRQMLQRPHFQHLLRGRASRCESGIHLAGSREKDAICSPVPPFPPARTGQGWKERPGKWKRQSCLSAGSFL